MRQIGKYLLKKVLGTGASGTVYLALDTFSGIEVALKVLDPRRFESPETGRIATTQFLNEASLAGKLSHPHIASILEAAVTDDSGYVALEYVPGGDLSQYTVPGKLLSREEVIQVAFKSCGALDYAFRQGIIHRDIKLANLLVASGTNIKVADFGAAFLKQSESTSLPRAGSPGYMSPEQINGEELGLHSDMYAMGVVLYALFAGRRPFTAKTIPELFDMVLTQDAVPPSTIRPEVGEDVDRIVLRMLAKSPAGRYPSWADLALDIAKIGRLSVYEQDIQDSEKFTALKRVPMLQGLDDATLWELVHAALWERLPARTTIITEGDFGNSLLFLASGQAKVTKRGLLLNILNAGECFGDMAYVKSGEPRDATVETLGDAVVAEFDPEAIRKTSLTCQFHLTRAILDSVVERLSMANKRMAGEAKP